MKNNSTLRFGDWDPQKFSVDSVNKTEAYV